MSPARAILAALALLGLGCSVPLGAEPLPGQANACGASSDCGSGATCAQGICVATDFDLTGLLIEVRPHSNASFGSTTSYVFDLADTTVALLSHGPGGGPFLTHLDLQLPQAFAVAGGQVRVSQDTVIEPSCNLGADRTIPAYLTFYRVPKYAGLPSDPIPADATSPPYTFDVDLVPDTYDVYVEPQPVAGCNGNNPYPPAFFPGQPIGTSGALSWVLPAMPPVGHLTGTITGFGDQAPATFKLDLLEPGRGLPISANATFTPIKGGYTIAADIAWQDTSTPILRLTPVTKPTDPVAPIAYWALDGSLFGGSQAAPVVAFTVDLLYSKPIMVGGQVRRSDDLTGRAASITIQSLMLPGADAENAALSVQSLETDSQGNFMVSLPPGGSYQLRAFPVDDSLAVTDRTLAVPAKLPAGSTCFCGQPFLLDRKLRLAGTVTTPTGEALADAAVNITPAQTLSPSFWLNAHALPPLAARPTTTTTGAEGAFTLRVDSGSSDLTIEAGAGSSFPWLVRPRLTVQTDAELSSLTLTSPAILGGSVADPSKAPVADAEVNAWFPVRDPSMPGGLTGVVVKIATTSTDAGGGYTLVLPSSI